MESRPQIHLPTAYLPPVSFFYFASEAGGLILSQYETYPKQTYRNRCEIYSANGKLALSIPISKPYGNRTITRQALLSKAENWPLRHWRSICTAYMAAPYFLYYQDEFEAIYKADWNNLLDFNQAFLTLVLDLIGMQRPITYSESFEEELKYSEVSKFISSPKHKESKLQFPLYTQVFGETHGFLPNLSIIDALFNLGPETISYLKSIKLLNPDRQSECG